MATLADHNKNIHQVADMEQKAIPKGFIDLPANIILSADGFQVLSASKTPIRRLTARGGQARDGLFSQAFNAATIQKMIMNSYIDEIYYASGEFLTKRPQIISTTNLVIYAMLYKMLSPTLARRVIESPVLREYNRRNPKNAIVDFKSIPQKVMDDFLTKNKAILARIEHEMIDAVLTRITSDKNLPEEDKIVRMRSLEKFVRWVDKRIWYLYLIIYQTPLKKEIETAYVELFFQYLDNTQVAVHTGNLVMEFIQNAEKAHLERVIVRNQLASRDQVDAYLRNKLHREQVVAMAERSKQQLEIAWHFQTDRVNAGKIYNVKIIISNFGLINESTRDSLAKKLKTDTSGISLSDFYEDSGETGKLGAGLGLLYNSYLEDVCREKGIRYFCTIFPEPRLEKTTVTLDLTF
ncbi:MAG TPA: hypothetical protein PKM44_02060 [Turneriella sp.]|nr:hypothetical protein [Turneriella sp.]HNE20698.1 hypothetical protein [Turneriella sp.]HNL09267.1 hypothetical protein [Turneriella sp.]HNL55304.1 hypothetical protein [Turneriella sp.]HNN00487.1 hypothetical protein [Turneriella sp.]